MFEGMPVARKTLATELLSATSYIAALKTEPEVALKVTFVALFETNGGAFRREGVWVLLEKQNVLTRL